MAIDSMRTMPRMKFVNIAPAAPGFRAIPAVVLPADGLWRHVSFELTTADLTLVGGVTSLGDVLANVQSMRILSSAAGPSWFGDAARPD